MTNRDFEHDKSGGLVIPKLEPQPSPTVDTEGRFDFGEFEEPDIWAVGENLRLLQVSENPTEVPNVYKELLELENPAFDPATREFQSDFVREFEAAWSKTRGEIPLSFWLQFPVEDLATVSSLMPEGVLYQMADNAFYQSFAQIQQETIDRMVEERLSQARETLNDALRNALGTEAQIGRARETVFGERMLEGVDASEFVDDIQQTLSFDEEAVKVILREQVLRELVGLPLHADPELDPTLAWALGLHVKDHELPGAVQWILKGLGIGVSGAVGAVANTTAFLVPGFQGALDISAIDLQSKQDETIAQLQELEGDAFNIAEAQFLNSAALEYEMLPEEEKAFWEELAGRQTLVMGSSVLGVGLFVRDRANHPTAKDQIVSLEAELRADLQEQIKLLENTDFGNQDAALNALAGAYNFFGDVTVGISLLLNFKDLRQQAQSGEWQGFLEEVKKHEHKLSSVWGIDGTFGGAALDFFGPELINPINYIFAPGRAANAGSRTVVRTAAEAVSYLDTGPGSLVMRETIGHLTSPTVSRATAVAHSGLDNIGMMELVRLLPGQTDNLQSLWKAHFPHAREVPPSVLEDLLPVGHVDDFASVKNAVERRGGWNRPIEVIQDADGRYFVSPSDQQAIAYAASTGDNVPAVVTRLDSRVAGYTGEQVDDLFRASKQAATSTEPTDVNRLLRGIEESASETDELIGTIGNGQYEVRIGTNQGRTVATALGDGTQRPIVYVVDTESGKIVGGYDWFEIGFDAGFRGKGLADEMIAMTRGRPDEDVLLRMAERANAPNASFTEHGIRLLKRNVDSVTEGKKFLSEVTGTLDNVADDVGTHTNPFNVFDETALIPSELAGPVRDIYMRSLLRNGHLRGQQYLSHARGLSTLVRGIVQDSKAAQAISRVITQQNTTRVANWTPANAFSDSMDMLARIWGSDTPKLNKWVDRIIDSISTDSPRYHRVLEIGEELKDVELRLAAIGDNLSGTAHTRLADNIPVSGQAAKKELEAVKKKLLAEQQKLQQAMSNTDELYKIVNESIDDFIRSHIANKRGWKKHVDPETGLVSRETLTRGYLKAKDPVTPGPVKARTQAPKELGDELTDALKITGIHKGAGFDFGVSPLDLVMASMTTSAAYTRLTHNVGMHLLREGLRQTQLLWVIDKVFKGSTAFVVSIDEWMRIGHLYGYNVALQWMKDKFLFWNSRMQYAMSRRNPFAFASKEASLRGSSRLSSKGQARMRQLQDNPDLFEQAMRSYYDNEGIGWIDIDPTDKHYVEHASNWANTFLENPGFRAFLDGKKSFRAWWKSSDSAQFRGRLSTVDRSRGGATTSRQPTMQEVFDGYEVMWGIFTGPAKKAGVLDEWVSAWKTTSQKITDTGKLHTLPLHVFDNFVPVRGASKLPRKVGPKSITDNFFDRLFMEPVQYRRGFLAELVRSSERKRLEQFYTSQGKQIIPDSALIELLDFSGYSLTINPGLMETLYHVWKDTKYVPESYVTGVIEKSVKETTENVLFNWHMSSPIGRNSKVAFPFGKPYADMMGFWMRDALTTPVLRGFLNEKNYLGMRTLANHLPINPRTATMVSRMAAADFHIDRGWTGVPEGESAGLLPGQEDADFSPAFFFPTEGDSNILGKVLPGIGFIPMALIDYVITAAAPDPVDDPIGHERFVEKAGDWVPYLEYQQGGQVSRLLGGGTVASLFSLGVDLAGIVGGVGTAYNMTSILGDISRETRRGREVNVIMADSDTWADLAAIDNAADLNAYLNGIVSDANKKASSSHALEVGSRLVLPADLNYDISATELQDVWIDAANRFQDIIGVDTSGATRRGEIRQTVDEIRNSFFKLENWERDLIIVSMPELAANLVASWGWTPKAIDANLPGSDSVYSTGGGPENSARHQWYVEQGYVRPLLPAQRVRFIVGSVAESRERLLKHLYEEAASSVNDELWEAVSGNSRINSYLNEQFETYGERFGILSVRSFWENWYQMEELIKEDLVSKGELEDGVGLGFPQAAKPWSVSWPGFSGPSRRFNERESLTLSDEARQIASQLGIDLVDGMTGEQLFNALSPELAKNEALSFATWTTSWQQYNSSRLTKRNVAEKDLNEAIHAEWNDVEWATGLTEWAIKVQNLRREYGDEPKGIPGVIRQQLVDEFLFFENHSSDKGKISWDSIWAGMYEGVLGPRDWTPPDPADPFDDDGKLSTHTKMPYIHDVVDGDTIVYSESINGPKFELRLLGVDSREFSNDVDGAREDTERLVDFLQQALENNDTIYIVFDPDRFLTNTDRYGRALAWLWAGDTPFYFVEEMNPSLTPAGDIE